MRKKLREGMKLDVGHGSGAFSFDVIEHSPDPRATLADIMSFVADGGVALIGQTLQPADIVLQRGN